VRLDRPVQVELPVGGLRRPAAFVALVLPIAMMVIGLVGAVVSAQRAERPDTEAIGTLGVELGAVLWFGGAITLGGRRGPTVLRIIGLVAMALSGMALIAVALLRSWTGAGLSLAMEFGVGAFAAAVIDVVLLGVVHHHVAEFSRSTPDRVLHLRLPRLWRSSDRTD
jgi:hypothetical protein